MNDRESERGRRIRIPVGNSSGRSRLAGRSFANETKWRKFSRAHGAEKGPWPSATHAVVQRRNDNTHPPLGLIKGIAWHEMQLFLHATTHTSYPSIRFTAMAGYTAHVSVRTRPVRCLMERRVCHPVMARHFALGTLNSRG